MAIYEPTIGLEIHVELKTKSKMFCSCKNDPKEETPNINICPICLAHPGTLPVINEEAVKMLIKTALALNCKINKKTFFERKNYFYPDLPKGYQISQNVSPLSENGYLNLPSGKKVRITRIHLEEDAAKLTHSSGESYSLVDFNRAGVPLMELVTEPDIKNAEEAKEFAKEFRSVVRYLGVSEADMEKGQMRCEVNISISKDKNLGTKVEIKNLNSIRSVGKAIEYEIKRQTELLEKGEKVLQETRGWDDKKEKTFSQRKKEESNDYRYFPEPDLPFLEISDEFLSSIEIPELPWQKRERFEKEYGISGKDVEIYMGQKELSNYFEEVVSELLAWVKAKKEKNISKEESFKLIKLASNYISTDLQALLKGGEDNLITPENFAEFVSMVYMKEISSKIAKDLLKTMFETGSDPSDIIKERGMKTITDKQEIEEVARKVIAKNEKAVEDYKKGKQTAIQFLVGQVMAETKGMADPDEAKESLKKILKASD